MDDHNIIYIDRREIGDEMFYKIWDDLVKSKNIPTTYEDIVDREWYERLNFCGCGMPEEARKLMLDVLLSISTRSASGWTVDTVKDELFKDQDRLHYFFMYVLDAMGLTEHGGSVGGSWTTTKGEQFLQLLQKEKHEDD